MGVEGGCLLQCKSLSSDTSDSGQITAAETRPTTKRTAVMCKIDRTGFSQPFTQQKRPSHLQDTNLRLGTSFHKGHLFIINNEDNKLLLNHPPGAFFSMLLLCFTPNQKTNRCYSQAPKCNVNTELLSSMFCSLMLGMGWVGKEGGGWWRGVVCLFHCGWGRRVGDGGGGRCLWHCRWGRRGGIGVGVVCLLQTPCLVHCGWGMGVGNGGWGVGGGGVCCLLHCESFSSDCLPGTRQAGPWWRCPRSGRGSLCCCWGSWAAAQTKPDTGELRQASSRGTMQSSLNQRQHVHWSCLCGNLGLGAQFK